MIFRGACPTKLMSNLWQDWQTGDCFRGLSSSCSDPKWHAIHVINNSTNRFVYIRFSLSTRWQPIWTYLDSLGSFFWGLRVVPCSSMSTQLKPPYRYMHQHGCIPQHYKCHLKVFGAPVLKTVWKSSFYRAPPNIVNRMSFGHMLSKSFIRTGSSKKA